MNTIIYNFRVMGVVHKFQIELEFYSVLLEFFVEWSDC